MATFFVYVLILPALLFENGKLENQDITDVDNLRFVKLIAGNSSLVTTAQGFSWEDYSRKILAPVIDSGYAFASINVYSVSFMLDTLFINLIIDSGYSVTVSKVDFWGNYKTSPKLLTNLTGFTPFSYSSKNINAFILLTEQADIKVKDWELTGHDSTAVLNLFIEENSKANRIFAGIGYAAQKELVGSVYLQLYNLFGRRREMGIFWQGFGKNKLELSFYAKDPYPFDLPIGLDISAGLRTQEQSNYNLYARAGAFIVRPGFELGLGYLFERIRLDSVYVSKNLMTSRFESDFLKLEAAVGERKASSTSAFFKAQFSAQIQLRLPYRFSLHFAPAGAALGSMDKLFTSELIPVGGASTLRGYWEAEFHEQYAFWSRNELRWGNENFSLYPLFDIAWIPSSGLALSYGAGILIVTSIGELELDVALPYKSGWEQAKLHLLLGGKF